MNDPPMPREVGECTNADGACHVERSDFRQTSTLCPIIIATSPIVGVASVPRLVSLVESRGDSLVGRCLAPTTRPWCLPDLDVAAKRLRIADRDSWAF